MTNAKYFGDGAKLSDDCWNYYGTYLKFENIRLEGADQVNISRNDLHEMEVCFNVYRTNHWNPSDDDGDYQYVAGANFFATDTMTGEGLTWPTASEGQSAIGQDIMWNGNPVPYTDMFNVNLTVNKTASLNGTLYTPGDDTKYVDPSDPTNQTMVYHHKWCLANDDFVRWFPETINPQPTPPNGSNGTANVTYTNYTVEMNLVMSALRNGMGNNSCVSKDDPDPEAYKRVVDLTFCDLTGTICNPGTSTGLTVMTKDGPITFMDFVPVLRLALYKSDDDSFNWLLWGGVGLAALVIIVLIVVFAVKGKGRSSSEEGTSL